MPFHIPVFSLSFSILLFWILSIFCLFNNYTYTYFIISIRLFSYLNSSGSSYSSQWLGLLVLPELYIRLKEDPFLMWFIIGIMNSSSAEFLLLVFPCGSHILPSFWKFACRVILCLLL